MSKIGSAEIISLSFGALGVIILTFASNQETAGASIVSNALTSYFAYKRGAEESQTDPNTVENYHNKQ